MFKKQVFQTSGLALILGVTMGLAFGFGGSLGIGIIAFVWGAALSSGILIGAAIQA